MANEIKENELNKVAGATGLWSASDHTDRPYPKTASDSGIRMHPIL